ncbi:DUF4112 domain-containing protein [Cyanobacteria bacterium FACHB-63]|nr:DUF4112 domain-containing protein [Cyanobacteria bacterium FACHB-63]
MQLHRDKTIARLRSLTHLLDNAFPIPGTKYRVGIDPIIGLLPGGGDVAMSFVSSYILIEAARLGLPRPTLLRMLWNLILDALLGIVPMAGDFVDLAWKANSKNLALIEAHLAKPGKQAKADYLFVALLIVIFLAVVIALGMLTVLVISTIWNAIAA